MEDEYKIYKYVSDTVGFSLNKTLYISYVHSWQFSLEFHIMKFYLSAIQIGYSKNKKKKIKCYYLSNTNYPYNDGV